MTPQEIAELLEKHHFAPQTAQIIAQYVSTDQRSMSVGTRFTGCSAKDLGTIWKMAQRSGAKEITLRIRLDSDDPCDAGSAVTEVIDRQDWPFMYGS